jgi:hypothetical protein
MLIIQTSSNKITISHLPSCLIENEIVSTSCQVTRFFTKFLDEKEYQMRTNSVFKSHLPQPLCDQWWVDGERQV